MYVCVCVCGVCVCGVCVMFVVCVVCVVCVFVCVCVTADFRMRISTGLF